MYIMCLESVEKIRSEEILSEIISKFSETELKLLMSSLVTSREKIASLYAGDSLKIVTDLLKICSDDIFNKMSPKIKALRETWNKNNQVKALIDTLICSNNFNWAAAIYNNVGSVKIVEVLKKYQPANTVKTPFYEKVIAELLPMYRDQSLNEFIEQLNLNSNQYKLVYEELRDLVSNLDTSSAYKTASLIKEKISIKTFKSLLEKYKKVSNSRSKGTQIVRNIPEAENMQELISALTKNIDPETLEALMVQATQAAEHMMKNMTPEEIKALTAEATQAAEQMMSHMNSEEKNTFVTQVTQITGDEVDSNSSSLSNASEE